MIEMHGSARQEQRVLLEPRGGAPKWTGDERQLGNVSQKNVWETYIEA